MKPKSPTIHARRRAIHRIGLNLGPERNRKIIEQIQRGKARFYKRVGCNKTQWIVSLDDELFTVIYSKTSKNIVTVWRNGKEEEVIKIPKADWSRRLHQRNSKTKQVNNEPTQAELLQYVQNNHNKTSIKLSTSKSAVNYNSKWYLFSKTTKIFEPIIVTDEIQKEFISSSKKLSHTGKIMMGLINGVIHHGYVDNNKLCFYWIPKSRGPS